MSQTILTSIYNKLVGASTLTAIVSTRIFQLEAPQATILPLLVFGVSEDSTEVFFASSVSTKNQSNLFFTAYFAPNSSVVTAMTLEEAIFDLFNKATVASSDGTKYADMQTICISRGSPTINTDSILVDMQYKIFSTKLT